MFGRLTLHAFQHNFMQAMVGLGVVLTALGIVGYLFYARRWRWLLEHWIVQLDPKKIGVMYLIVAGVMLLKGVSDAGLIRLQQLTAVGEAQGILSSDHFQQIFTAHGSTMIFFVGMGIVFGLSNLVVPLQIGARDVAFPFLNAVSFWLFASGAALLIISMLIGDFSAAGWVNYPPLSGIKYSPGEGVDYWIWAIQIAGVGSLLAGINFFTTIFKMRCPGMSMMRMPLFTWSILCTMVLVIFAFPILTVTAGLLALDRYLAMHFFTSDFGGNPMMYINLIWAWGHPEVYILVLPAFGVFSEVVATFSHKRLFGYNSMVWALGGITLLSFIVWLHHFFTMGAGANVNAFFGIMTMFIAIPTGVKIFNWIFTNFRGRIHFATPMLWFFGFIVIFTIGGMDGVLMSIPPVDFQVHNSLFLIAHFHSVLIGGVLFGFFAGYTYWFPKIFGFKLDEKLGRRAFVCWFVGFLCAFLPLYILGLMGATRRLDYYDPSMGWKPLFIVAAIGVTLVSVGIGFQITQLIVSIKNRKKNLDTTGDPWNGRTLEWATSSPPPVYNFAKHPVVQEIDPFWEMKQRKEKPHLLYEDIHVPRNTGTGFNIGALSVLFGFALTWHITWLTLASIAGIIATIIIRGWEDNIEYTIHADEVKKREKAWQKP